MKCINDQTGHFLTSVIDVHIFVNINDQEVINSIYKFICQSIDKCDGDREEK